MSDQHENCPDCTDTGLDRRDFFRVAAAATSLPLWATPLVTAAPTPKSAAETAVNGLYDTLTDEQRKEVCFEWDYQDKKRGLLRTFVSNNWQITKPHIRSDYYTKKQQDIIHDIWKGMINPEWYGKFVKQLKDDTHGAEWGAEQSLAIFGTPGSGKFEFVMTGRHMTIRADGDSAASVAFGGPIFYGHAASGFTEKTGHPGNVFWPQAVLANKVYQMIDPKQQAKALVVKRPDEAAVPFRGPAGMFTGLPVSELPEEHKKELQKALLALIEPFRKEDQAEALDCLKAQGGLDKCHLTYYKEGAQMDGTWDNWRLEGPAFVWYFRGTPHVHVWVNVASDPAIKLNSRG